MNDPSRSQTNVSRVRGEASGWGRSYRDAHRETARASPMRANPGRGTASATRVAGGPLPNHDHVPPIGGKAGGGAWHSRGLVVPNPRGRMNSRAAGLDSVGDGIGPTGWARVIGAPSIPKSRSRRPDRSMPFPRAGGVGPRVMA